MGPPNTTCALPKSPKSPIWPTAAVRPSPQTIAHCALRQSPADLTRGGRPHDPPTTLRIAPRNTRSVASRNPRSVAPRNTRSVAPRNTRS
eukprot:5783838-Prymnesium_polylepis.1